MLTLATHSDYAAPPLPVGEAWHAVFVSIHEMHWTRSTLKDGTAVEYFPVERRIQEAGYETFVPRERRIKLRAGRKVEVVTPLFGSYVFVRFDRAIDSWGEINFLDGVHQILSNLQIPIRIPERMIETFQAAEQAGVFDYRKPRAIFSTGDSVEIMHGPFAGLVAKVRCASPRKRVKLLMDGLGKLEIDAEYLMKV